MNEAQVEISRPCVTLQTGTAGGRFEGSFCLETAARLLEMSGYFDRAKISKRLEVLKTYGKLKMLLFKDGTASISPVEDREEAFHLLQYLGGILWGALICEKNGNRPVLECTKICKNGCAFAIAGRIKLAGQKMQDRSGL